jgi:hypothetical protein
VGMITKKNPRGQSNASLTSYIPVLVRYFVLSVLHKLPVSTDIIRRRRKGEKTKFPECQSQRNVENIELTPWSQAFLERAPLVQ